MASKTKSKTKKKDKKVADTKSVTPYAYTIKDAAFGELNILNSANAWWMNTRKVEDLIAAFKLDATYEEACVNAGITPAQLRYFMEQHLEFSQVIGACRELPNLTARKSVISQMEKDGNLALRYLAVKKSGEFGPKPPVVAVQINMAEQIQDDREKFSKVTVKTSTQ